MSLLHRLLWVTFCLKKSSDFNIVTFVTDVTYNNERVCIYILVGLASGKIHIEDVGLFLIGCGYRLQTVIILNFNTSRQLVCNGA